MARMNGDYEGIIFRRGTVGWAPLPSFNYSSHIWRDVGGEGWQARWERQGWCAAVQMNVQPQPKKGFPWWDNMVEENTNVPTGTTRQEARLENSLAMIGSSPRKS